MITRAAFPTLFLLAYLCLGLIVLLPVTARSETVRTMLAGSGDRAYENAVISEDVTWKGTVIIRGSVVVAPQATLRIDPGAVVRFVGQAGMKKARLVVQGRLHCAGAPERPVLLGSAYADPRPGDWGGILLLASEKRNLIEQCRIEGADRAIDARFSNISVKSTAISHSATAVALRDSTAVIAALSVSGGETGLDIYDSEVEIQEGLLQGSRTGIAVRRSGLAMHKVQVKNISITGLDADECRIKITSCEFSSNAVGARLKGGEGQINASRFLKNRDIGLHLAGIRLKIQRSSFDENLRDALRTDDGRSTVTGSSFSSNGGFNLVSSGADPVAVSQNWWGGGAESSFLPKFSTSGASIADSIIYSPWLTEKPAGLP